MCHTVVTLVLYVDVTHIAYLLSHSQWPCADMCSWYCYVERY